MESVAGELLDIKAVGAPRPRHRPRLLVLDLDGTCIDGDTRLQARVRAAVRSATVPVVMATGRMYRSALPWAEELAITAPLIAYHGALVRELPGSGGEAGATLIEESLDGTVAGAILRVAREHDWHFQAFRDDELLYERDRPELHQYTDRAAVSATLVADLEPLVSAGVTKAMCVIDDPVAVLRCIAVFGDMVGPTARITQGWTNFVEITSVRATKSRALAVLCERMGIAIEETVAVGDAPNDVDMLDVAGFAVAVNSGDPAVLAHADVTCMPPALSGVADVIEALGLANTNSGTVADG